jgi:BlaI family transcriptional regulator, penicillinase repressor
MARPKKDVTEKELEIMEILWGQGGSGGATVRGIAGRIYPRGGFAQYTTVKKLIERLEEKGFVARKTDRMAHEFSAAVERDELIGRRLRAMADQLGGGSLVPLVSGLVKAAGPLKRSEIEELRALVDRLDRSRRK